MCTLSPSSAARIITLLDKKHTQKTSKTIDIERSNDGALQRDDKRQRCDLDFSIIHSCVDADDVDEDANDDVIRIRLSLGVL